MTPACLCLLAKAGSCGTAGLHLGSGIAALPPGQGPEECMGGWRRGVAEGVGPGGVTTLRGASCRQGQAA
jgi:hypothetical protein